MTAWKTEILRLFPLMLGLYCVVHGSVLPRSEVSLVQFLGVGVLLWVSTSVYYAWRGRKIFLTRAPAPMQIRRRELETLPGAYQRQ